MSKLSRRDLFRLQAHALVDGVGLCPGGIPQRDHFDAQLPKLPCPICLRWKTLDELDEDHAPQRAGQSSLGQPHVVVMVCRVCNRRAGGTYEARVDRENRLLYEVPSPFCEIHSRVAATPSGLTVKRDLSARAVTDLKSAFLVATATLGYRWAASPRLESIRQVIRGELSPMLAASDFEFICLHSAQLRSFGVYEVSQPVRCVLVIGAHAGVVLPCATSGSHLAGRLVTDLGGGYLRIRCTAHRRSWPANFTSSRPVEQAWDAHELFHYDRCLTGDHRRFALAPDELAASVGLADAA